MEHFYEKIGEDWFDYQDIYKNMVLNAKTNSWFVEVGSWKGRSSVFMAVEIINSNKEIKFDCIDTWLGSTEHTDPNSGCFVKELNDEKDWLYREFLKNIDPVKHIIKPIRSLSVDASKLYSDNSLDFVWIDAAHDYDNVYNDLIHWYPKVKSGGYIGGHDYHKNCGVEDAVNDFFSNEKVERINKSWLKKVV